MDAAHEPRPALCRGESGNIEKDKWGEPNLCRRGSDNTERGPTVKKLWHSKTLRIIGTLIQAFLAVAIVHYLSEGYILKQVPVGLIGEGSPSLRWRKENNLASFTGTWVRENGKQFYPLQISKVVCIRSEQICEESKAIIFDTALGIENAIYRITHWDDHTIIYGEEDSCLSIIYTVSRNTKQISGVQKNRPGSEKCDYDAEVYLRLANGSDVEQRMRQEAQPVAATRAAWTVILVWAGLRIRRIIKSQPAA